MDKSIFIKTMEEMNKQMSVDKSNAILMSEAFNIDEFPLYDNSSLYKTIISLLGLFVNKEELEHYIFFCNFGKINNEEDWENFDELYERIKLKDNAKNH